MSHGLITNGTYRKNEDDANQLRMGGGSWSINIAEIEGKDVYMIKYITKERNYLITIDKAIEHGFERTLGGERKLVVPLKYWSILKRGK